MRVIFFIIFSKDHPQNPHVNPKKVRKTLIFWSFWLLPNYPQHPHSTPKTQFRACPGLRTHTLFWSLARPRAPLKKGYRYCRNQFLGNLLMESPSVRPGKCCTSQELKYRSQRDTGICIRTQVHCTEQILYYGNHKHFDSGTFALPPDPIFPLSPQLIKQWIIRDSKIFRPLNIYILYIFPVQETPK